MKDLEAVYDAEIFPLMKKILEVCKTLTGGRVRVPDVLDLKAIEQRVEAARPGPWHVYDRGIGFEVHSVHSGSNSGYCHLPTCHTLTDGQRDTLAPGDAAFVAAARQDVPALIEEIRRLREVMSEAAHRAADDAMMYTDGIGEHSIADFLKDNLE